jgi:Fe2+ or Zn2+ uptake regulation protein
MEAVGPDDQLRSMFKEAGRRLTRQRRLILDVLRESDGHLDADSVYDRAKSRISGLSLATVYRTLTLLKDLGLVEEHRLGEGHSHYEAVQEEPHYHFTCQSCGQVIEFDAPLMTRIRQEVCEREEVCVVDVHLHMIGYCAQCKDQWEGKNCNEE